MQNNARKNIIYSIILLLVVFGVFLYRQNKELPAPADEAAESNRITVSGKTMGTTYRVVYLDVERRDFQSSIDSILTVFNQSLSTYIPESELSRFNQNDTLAFDLPYLLPVLEKSREVYELSGGAFDPTVGSLVNAWGFGPDGAHPIDSINVDSLLPLIGFDKIQFNQDSLWKAQPGIYLDFNAIAKGYAVDVVAELLEKKGISDMLVEIGGELVGKGVNEKGEIWKVGINRPDKTDITSELFSIIALDNKALATSGNYRNYYMVDSVRYSHTINPLTGYPVQHGLLSATVIAEDCMTADAFATAMMVLGLDKSIELLDKAKALEAYLIYNDDSGNVKTYISDSLVPFISDVND